MIKSLTALAPGVFIGIMKRVNDGTKFIYTSFIKRHYTTKLYEFPSFPLPNYRYFTYCVYKDLLAMIHIIYTYKGKVYQSFKSWNVQKIERVLTRLGATYWEIGM